MDVPITITTHEFSTYGYGVNMQAHQVGLFALVVFALAFVLFMLLFAVTRRRASWWIILFTPVAAVLAWSCVLGYNVGMTATHSDNAGSPFFGIERSVTGRYETRDVNVPRTIIAAERAITEKTGMTFNDMSELHVASEWPEANSTILSGRLGLKRGDNAVVCGVHQTHADQKSSRVTIRLDCPK